jgi:CO/xanthine dehydrogenase FAD-binding subunit
VQTTGVARPKNLREALGVAFVHRTRTRWRAGTSRLLGLDYPGPETEGFVVDVADIIDFREIRTDRETLRIGAFADPDSVLREPLLGNALGSTSLAADVVRFRFAALGARLIVAGIGATRTAPLAEALGAGATRPLSPSEIPVAVEVETRGPSVSFGDRRLHRRDGEATFDLRVYAALTLAAHHKIAAAQVAYSVDASELTPLPAVEATLRGAQIAKTTFADAARHAADAFHGDEVRANTLRRSIIPLVLSTLKDAYDDACANLTQREGQRR